MISKPFDTRETNKMKERAKQSERSQIKGVESYRTAEAKQTNKQTKNQKIKPQRKFWLVYIHSLRKNVITRLVLQRLVLGITKRGEVHSKDAGDFGNGLDGVLFHVYTAISERLSLTCDFYSDGLFFGGNF